MITSIKTSIGVLAAVLNSKCGKSFAGHLGSRSRSSRPSITVPGGCIFLSSSGSFQGDGTASTWKLQGRDPALLQRVDTSGLNILCSPVTAGSADTNSSPLTREQDQEHGMGQTAASGYSMQVSTKSGKRQGSEVAQQGKPKKPHHSSGRISLLLSISQFSLGPPDLAYNTP